MKACIATIAEINRAKYIERLSAVGYLEIRYEEYDLVLVIDRIVTLGSGKLAVHWIDGSKDWFQIEVQSQEYLKTVCRINHLYNIYKIAEVLDISQFSWHNYLRLCYYEI